MCRPAHREISPADARSRLARKGHERLERVCDDLDRLYLGQLFRRVRSLADMQLVRRSASARFGIKLLVHVRAEPVARANDRGLSNFELSIESKYTDKITLI